MALDERASHPAAVSLWGRGYTPSGPMAYLAAAALVGGAVLLWLMASGHLDLGPGDSFLVFCPVVAVVAYIGGPGAVVLATLLGIVAGVLLTTSTEGSDAMRHPVALLHLGLLAGTGLVAAFWLRLVQREVNARTRTIEEVQRNLAASEERLHAVFEQAGVGICLATFTGEMRMVNRKLCDLLGYGREELLKLSYKDITYPEDWPPQVVQAQRLKAGEIDHYTMEKRYIRKDGSLVWANLTCSAIRGEPYVVAVVEDVNERKRMEDDLRRVQERYSALFDRSQDCVYILDFEGNFLDANPAALKLLGYTREEIATTKLASLIDPDQMEMAMMRIGEARRTGSTETTAEFRLRRKDGETVYVGTKASVILHNGQPVAIQGIARDMTQRKREEAALRESEEKFRKLAEVMHAAVGIVQGKGFVYVNPYMGQMLGYSVEEILHMDFVQLIHPDHRARMMDYARRRQMGEDVPAHYEFVAITKTGESRWVDFTAARIEYRGQPAIVGTGFDITERKLAEKRLQAHTRGLRLLVDTATRLLAAQRPQEVLREVFDELAGYLGVQIYLNYLSTGSGRLHLNAWHGLEETAIERIRDVEFGQTPCAQAAEERRRVVIHRVQGATDEKARMLKELGVRAYACHPLVVNESVTGTVAFCALDRDSFGEGELELMRAVTHQAAMALEHQRLRAELERHAADLADASHAKDQFMATLSHELRTPLTPVLAAAGMLESEKAIPAEAQEYVDVIKRNAELEARLIDDLLDVTRIVRGKIELDKEVVDLHMVISRAVEVCKEDVAARGLHLRMDLGSQEHCWVEADADRLQQVFWNLLKNSIKFTPSDGCVGVRCRGTNGRVVVEVIDSGEGIAPEALGRIFRPFEQAERSITRQFGGLGLGLAISKALVELHGGSISAFSEGKGKGALFRVELPRVKHVAEQAERGNGKNDSEARGVQRQLRILLVEDHGDTAKMLSRLLRNEGYLVEHASDVATAESLAERAAGEGRPYDLLLSDLGLPDASGNDLMRHLRAHGQTVPGIALSGYGMASDMEQSREAGFSEHVTKPVSFPTLKEAIVRTVRGGRPGHGAR